MSFVNKKTGKVISDIICQHHWFISHSISFRLFFYFLVVATQITHAYIYIYEVFSIHFISDIKKNNMQKVLIILAIFFCYSFILVKCQRPSECKLEHDAGPCRGLFPKYYFNDATNQCERFNYGGCQGKIFNYSQNAFDNFLFIF